LANGISIDKNGKFKGTFNVVAYLKVAPDDFKSSIEEGASKAKGVNPQAYRITRMVNSKDWRVARIIYATITLKGKIVLS